MKCHRQSITNFALQFDSKQHWSENGTKLCFYALNVLSVLYAYLKTMTPRQEYVASESFFMIIMMLRMSCMSVYSIATMYIIRYANS